MTPRVWTVSNIGDVNLKLYLNCSRVTLAASLALMGAPALAQTGPNDDTVIVTGTLTPLPAEKLGQTITVISGDLIGDQGYNYGPDVLRQVPSVAVSQPGAPGALTQVRIRGGEANHSLVLIDGIDISSPDQGETDFSTLLTGDVDRIEILRGPQSGLYGSNALAGVVNLVSRTDIDKGYAAASIEGGSFDTYEIEASAGIGNGDDYAAISVNHLTSEGYDISPDQTANGAPAVGVGGQPGDKEGNAITALNLRGGLRLDENVRITGIARYVTKEAALDHVAGACVVNDVSEREYQLERLGTWDKGKGCDTFGPFGPYLVTLDEVGDLNNLGLWLDLNGKRMQTGSTASLIFDVPTIVSYVSQFMSLQPGDVISTGTPPGVGLGMKPPVFLKEGDVMELGIDKLGSQKQSVKRTKV